ncbi:hypothetical protein HZS_5311 [Henneguya salminicola]|nr:hypothetical protein HZS_5311 [Henneguya salminicola]
MDIRGFVELLFVEGGLFDSILKCKYACESLNNASSMIYIGFSYHNNNPNEDTIYYRLNVKNDFIITKGNHSCKQIISEKADIPELETSPNILWINLLMKKLQKLIYIQMRYIKSY